jgi:hypothetical protein
MWSWFSKGKVPPKNDTSPMDVDQKDAEKKEEKLFDDLSYDFDTITASFTGNCWGANSPQTAAVHVERHWNVVHIHLPAVSAVPGAGAAVSTIVMTALPVNFRPPAVVNIYPDTITNAASTRGRIQIGTDGIATIAASSVGGDFSTIGGANGWSKQLVSFSRV